MSRIEDGIMTGHLTGHILDDFDPAAGLLERWSQQEAVKTPAAPVVQSDQTTVVNAVDTGLYHGPLGDEDMPGIEYDYTNPDHTSEVYATRAHYAAARGLIKPELAEQIRRDVAARAHLARTALRS